MMMMHEQDLTQVVLCKGQGKSAVFVTRPLESIQLAGF